MNDAHLRVLVVEDDVLLRDALADQLRDWSFEVDTAGTFEEGMLRLEEDWTFLLLDIDLPGNGSGLDIARRLAARTLRPLTLAITGTATVDEAFELARLGVRAYFSKPLSVADLRETMRTLLSDTARTSDGLEALVRAEVGTASYHDVAIRVRRAMVDQALRLSGGNRSGAARILRLSRQAIQQMIRSLDLPEGQAS